ncbi:MAG: DUF4224 domain-containing protein [Woeseia sp.]
MDRAEFKVIVDFPMLCRLSGRERPSAVCKWLQQQGIAYMLNADGKPVTTERALNEALLRGRKTEPNWPASPRHYRSPGHAPGFFLAVLIMLSRFRGTTAA